MRLSALLAFFLLLQLSANGQAQEIIYLGEPEPVTLEDGTHIDVLGYGKAAPIYQDFNGDGVPDLLVGEFKDGTCHIFINHGTATEPIFKESSLFMADGDVAIIPPS